MPRWPLSNYEFPLNKSGSRINAAEALRSADYRLLSRSESVAGEECAIFDNKGIDRIWIATNKGLCLMRREMRDPNSRKLIERILTEKVDLVAPRLWLPTEFRNQYLSNTNEAVIERESRVHVLRFELNDNVPESIFIPVHRPGSLKYESGDENRFTQMTPGGEDLLDDIVSFMVKYVHLPTKPIPRNRHYVWLVGGLGTGLCAGFLLFPMSKRHSMKGNIRDTPVSASGLKL